MEGKTRLNNAYAKLFLLLLFSVGLAGHTMEISRKIMVFMTPASLAVASAVVMYPFLMAGNRRFFIWCSITLFITCGVEYIGVKTGIFFGHYAYGNVLGVKLFDVPLIIGINWMLIILGALSIAQLVTRNILLTATIAGCLAVIFDYILEPVAIFLSYWQWESGTPPLSNYCTWFMLAFFMTLLYCKIQVSAHTDLPHYYFCLQILFFFMLNLLLLR